MYKEKRKDISSFKLNVSVVFLFGFRVKFKSFKLALYLKGTTEYYYL